MGWVSFFIYIYDHVLKPFLPIQLPLPKKKKKKNFCPIWCVDVVWTPSWSSSHCRLFWAKGTNIFASPWICFQHSGCVLNVKLHLWYKSLGKHGLFRVKILILGPMVTFSLVSNSKKFSNYPCPSSNTNWLKGEMLSVIIF